MGQMAKKRYEYLKEYKKKNIKRIPLEVGFDFYDKIQLAARAEGQSVNGYIKHVLELSINGEQIADGNHVSDSEIEKRLKIAENKIAEISNVLIELVDYI